MRKALWLVIFVCGGCACDQKTNPPHPSSNTESKRSINLPGLQTKFGGLIFALPPEFVQVDDTSDESPSLIPGEAPTREDFRSYKTRDGNWIFMFHWNGFPAHDRGPMVVEQEWETVISGRPARISLTSTFFGIPQRVLTAHFQASNGDRYLIYTKTGDPNLVPDRARFMSYLTSIRF
jgi:hypothetical protein